MTKKWDNDILVGTALIIHNQAWLSPLLLPDFVLFWRHEKVISAPSKKYFIFVVRFPENIVVYIHQKRRADNTQNYTQINRLFVVLKKKMYLLFATSRSVFAQMHNCSDASAICGVFLYYSYSTHVRVYAHSVGWFKFSDHATFQNTT